MKKLTKKEIERRIEEINDARADALQALADEVREQLIVPICKKTGFNYMAGNGETMFSKGEIRLGSVDDCILDRHRKMIPALDLVCIEVGRDDYLGYYMSDVKET